MNRKMRLEPEAAVMKLLTEVLPDIEFKESHASPDPESTDFQITMNDWEYLVEVKYFSMIRIQELIGSLSASILRTKRLAKNISAMPLVLGYAPRIGSKAVERVEEFMSLNADDVSWGLLDQAGRVRLHFPAQGLDVDRRSIKGAEKAEPERSRQVQLFSDLNRWLLKILLLRDAPAGMWGGPRELVDTPTLLGRVGNVSVAKAHRFFNAFEDRNYLRRTAEGIRVVRKELLMNAWMTEEIHHQKAEMPARFLFEPTDNPLERLTRLPDQRFAISGFEACRLHGVLHTVSPGLTIHVEDDFSAFLEHWDLEECTHRDANVVLTRQRYPESVFRGTVMFQNLPVVDLLQAALDVRPLKSRGLEQAEFIIHHVFKWSDEP